MEVDANLSPIQRIARIFVWSCKSQKRNYLSENRIFYDARKTTYAIGKIRGDGQLEAVKICFSFFFYF